jgi:hypothetical protein
MPHSKRERERVRNNVHIVVLYCYIRARIEFGYCYYLANKKSSSSLLSYIFSPISLIFSIVLCVEFVVSIQCFFAGFGDGFTKLHTPLTTNP